MRTHFTSIFSRFTTMVALVVTLVGSAAYVTPVHAASIVVNTNADNRADDGFCTLREAIIAAVGNFSSGVKAGECAAGSTGVDSISFVGNYTITVGSQLPYVTTAMTITGKGAANTIIQAAANPNTATWRVFQVTPTGNLTLDGVTVRNGRCYDSCTVVGDIRPNAGGGIYNTGTLTIKNSTISANQGLQSAGGVYNSGTLTVIESNFSGNTSPAHDAYGGGGIYNTSTLTVINSTFSENSGYYGGGIFNEGGTLNVSNSTFSGNHGRVGGGINNLNNGTLSGIVTVINTTFYGNSAETIGGGGIANGGALTVTNSTFSGNSAGMGGQDIHGSSTLKNTIIASSPYTANCYGNITNGGNNLDSGTSCGWDSTNGSMSNTNPKLDALANNGGPTQTIRLLTGSPAIDAGNASFCSASPVNGVDQRGVSRPLGFGCDIGAFETSNGDGPDTAGVFRPSNGLLYLKNLNITGFADIAINYGVGGDYPVVGDWDGNGTATIGIYRNGSFYLRNSNTIGFADSVFAFGQVGDQPIAGDWDVNGTDTIGVYRPSTGQFLLRNSNSAGPADMSFYLGNVGDVGIAGDWNGDGIDTTGVFRPSNGIIFLKNTNSTGFADIALNYGIPGDKPLTGDWNDDGIDTIGVYRGNNFYLRNSNTIGFADIVFALGIPGDMPIAGNWDAAP